MLKNETIKWWKKRFVAGFIIVSLSYCLSKCFPNQTNLLYMKIIFIMLSLLDWHSTIILMQLNNPDIREYNILVRDIVTKKWLALFVKFLIICGILFAFWERISFNYFIFLFLSSRKHRDNSKFP